MKLKYRINLVSLPILLGVAFAIGGAGLMAINNVTYDLNRKLMAKEVENLTDKLLSAHQVLVENGLAGIEGYVRLAQNEMLGQFSGYQYGKTGMLMVIDLPDRLLLPSQPPAEDPLGMVPVADMIRDHFGTREFTFDREKRFFSFRTFPRWNWLIALSVTRNEMFDVQNRFLQQVVVILLVSVLLGTSLLLWFTHRLVKPIRLLAAATGQVSQGHWDVPLPAPGGTEELARLTRAFGEMAQSLARMYENLQENLHCLECSQLELQKSEEKYRELVEVLPQIIFEADADGRLLFANKNTFDTFGYTESDFDRGLNLFDLFTAEDRSRVRKKIAEILLQGQTAMMEYSAVKNEGKTFPVIFMISPREQAGKTVGFRGILIDITERKALENELIRTRQFLQDIINTVPDPVFVKDRSHRWILLNHAYCSFLGCERSELLRKTEADFFSPKEAREIRERDEAIFKTGESKENEVLFTNLRGGRHTILVKKAIFEDADGQRFLIGSIRDITERKQMEQEMLKAQKLESIGVLAGGIAHDFNNLLTGILGNISLAKLYTASDEKVRAKLAKTEQACLRAKDLTRQLLTFSRGGAPVKKLMCLKGLIREAVTFALRGSNVSCELMIPEDLWAVEADEGQINQVMNNLILNAKQAMPDGGVIRAAAENFHVQSSQNVPIGTGLYVRISVQDQGNGISGEYLPKIFDPYYTTKEKGSGLGLAMVFSIIKRHQGHVHADSAVGVGSTFHIYLPAKTQRALASQPSESAVIYGTGKILVMDDEETVREVAGEMLTILGYEPVFAKEGGEAIRIYRESADAFGGVIMDLTVPGGMGGKEAAARLLMIDPDARIIVSSGYSIDPVMADYKAHRFAGRITKPFEISELSRVLDEVLHPERAGNAETVSS